MKNNIKYYVIILVIVLIGGYLLFKDNIFKNNTTKITEKMYVAVEGAGKVAVIDTNKNKVFKIIDLSENKNGITVNYMPHNIEVAPDNKSVWVTANAVDEEMKMSFQVIPKAYAAKGHDEDPSSATKSKDQIIIIDPFSDLITKRIEIGTDLHLSHISITPDSSYAITASQERGILYKINATTFEIEKEVVAKKDGGPHGLRISPDGKTAYIAMLGGKSLGILDIESFNLKDVGLKGSAVQTGVTPDGKYALASVYETKSLAILDILTSELKYIDLPKEAKGPVQIYPTPDSRYVYIADQGYYFDQPAVDTVYRIDLEEMKIAKEIKAGIAPHGVVVSKDGKFVYITNLLSDDVSVIDTELGKEIEKIKVGKMPNGISLWHGKDRIISGNLYEEKVISQNGLHWHSELAIYVKGVKIEIPANIGLGAVHNPVHTHDEDASKGVIHLEFGGVVRKNQTKLGEFFKSWNKDIRSFGSNIKMKVNGIENTEFENYFMKDGDKIELRYE